MNIKKVIIGLEMQRNYFNCTFFLIYKMRKELVFNNGYNDCTKDKYCFQKDKKKQLILIK